jgi:hypothetical protein
MMLNNACDTFDSSGRNIYFTDALERGRILVDGVLNPFCLVVQGLPRIEQLLYDH